MKVRNDKMNTLMKRLVIIVSISVLLTGCANSGNKKPTASTVQMSDDIYDFTIDVAGDVIQLPTTVTTLETLGWKTGENLDEKLDPNTNAYGITFRKDGDKEISASFTNLSDRTMLLKDSFITDISLYLDSFDTSKVPSVTFSKGISTTSTLTEVLEVFGEPTDRSDTKHSIRITYQLGDDYNNAYDFSFEKNDDPKEQVMMDFSVSNTQLNDEQKASIKTEVSKTAPAYVKDYKMPETLGTSYKDWRIKYGDDVYEMPVPVKVLVENGWTLLSEDEVIPAKSYAYSVRLRYENSSISVRVANYDENPQYVSNSVVVSFEYDDYSSKIPFELPGGITPNSTLEEIEEAYGKGDLDTNYLTSLTYGDYDKGLTFYFDDDGVMSNMEYEYYPESID